MCAESPSAKDFLQQLTADLGAVELVAGTSSGERLATILARARRLLVVKLWLEVQRPAEAPPLVVIAGGTNVGKSTVFNWLIGREVASAAPLARHTRAPTFYVKQQDVASLGDGALLPDYERVEASDGQAPPRRLSEAEGEDGADADEDGPLTYFLLSEEAEGGVNGISDGLVLVDSPDFDSVHPQNRRTAEDLLFLADGVVFVTTGQKYNDKVCVDYLKDAAELDKKLVCVLNQLQERAGDADVRRDFRTQVVEPLPGGEQVAVVEVPWESQRPDPAAQGAAHVDSLREATRLSASDAQRLRQASLLGARRRLAADLQRVIARLREERAELDRLRAEVEAILLERRDEYARFLAGLEFYELDRVFQRVLEYFRIPLLDDVYDGLRGAAGFVVGGLSRLVSGKQPRDSQSEKLAARSEKDRQKVKELLEETRVRLLELPTRSGGLLAEAAPGWVTRIPTRGPEEREETLAEFVRQSEEASERWIEGETKKQVEYFEKHPAARNGLRTLKGGLQVGFGVLSAMVMGISVYDLVVGPAAERGAKFLLESFGGRAYYVSLKKQFTQARSEVFLRLLREHAAAPVLGVVPAGVDPERLERLDKAARRLAEEGE